MKKRTKLLLALIAALVTLAVSAVCVFAAEGGVTAALTSDKAEYSAGDVITLTLKVENNGAAKLVGVKASLTLPDGVELADGQSAEVTLPDAAAKGSADAAVQLVAAGKKGGCWSAISTASVVLIGAALAVAAVLLTKGKKKSGGASAAIIALALVPVLAAVIYAADGSVKAEVKVKIDGTEKTISANVTYSEELGAAGSIDVSGPSEKDLAHFALDEVALTDGYGVNALEKELEYLESFDVDRLLAGFRETAGLDMKGKTRYDGWENTLIGGHSVGHYMSAVAQAYKNAGTPEADREKLYSIITELIDGLKECQENSKGQPGFIFGSTIVNKSNVEAQFDNVERGQSNINTQAWVPWYTMHKIIAGLCDVYKFTGYEPALEVAKGLGDWTYGRTSGWSAGTKNTVLSIEYGGMNDCLYELFALTDDEKYAEAAHAFDEETLFKRVAKGTKDALNNLHANTTIPKFIGALNRYVTLGDYDYLKYAESFWTMVTEHHTYITGGNSEWEHFGADDVLDAERTNCNCETCNVYNMLKLSKMLFEITGERKYADYYENAFYNAILSSQNPETGMTTYFQPMATGYFKVYSEPFTKFWCCTGSGMENFTKLNDSIYFRRDNVVFVNMYFDSTVKVGDVTLTQDSTIPEGDTSVFTVSGNASDLVLALRIPDWAAGDVKVKVNGSDFAYTKKDNGYAYVPGPFADGTKIEITIPMNVTVSVLPDNERTMAFKYGPIVLSAGLGRENMTTTTTGVIVTIPADKVKVDENIVLPEGVSRDDFIKNVNDYMKRDGDGLTFTLAGTELKFGPHYEKYDERYGIYWNFVTLEEKEAEDAASRRTEEVVIDTVQPGYGQYENDELHAMVESGSVGVTNDGTYRYANAGGYFTYRMSVKRDGNNYLVMQFRRDDNGKTIRVVSGETVIFEATLDYSGKDDIYEVRVKLPDEVASAAETVTANGEEHDVVTLTFSGIDGAESARVCEFIYVKDVTVLYAVDEKVAYFVDCGDHDTTTLSDGDKFGVYNSLTEQLYGYDPVTGMKWGLVDDPEDRHGGSSISGALYTSHTWAYEFNPKDGQPKTETNRYTKNQYEEGIAERYLDYSFELPNGTYEVEIGFSNPWNCSNMHNVYANLGRSGEATLAESYNVSGGPIKATVEVTDGVLTLNFRNSTGSGLAINVTYILITFK